MMEKNSDLKSKIYDVRPFFEAFRNEYKKEFEALDPEGFVSLNEPTLVLCLRLQKQIFALQERIADLEKCCDTPFCSCEKRSEQMISQDGIRCFDCGKLMRKE